LGCLPYTNPVEAGLSAELVGSSGAEVVVRSEGLVERGDEVEKSLPAALVAQGVLPALAALPQAGRDKHYTTFKKKKNSILIAGSSVGEKPVCAACFTEDSRTHYEGLVD